MLNVAEIEKTIQELENGTTSFDTCLKLASLYIVRQNINTTLNDKNNVVVEHELDDILPRYRDYVEIKQKFQLKLMPEVAVIAAMENVCKEIKEFLQTLYSSTDMPQERQQIKEMLQVLISSI